jgi:hypothetical protein
MDVGVGVNDDGVFAAHFQDGALDPDLARTAAAAALLICRPTSRDPVKAM